jgi:hypothetical protein
VYYRWKLSQLTSVITANHCGEIIVLGSTTTAAVAREQQRPRDGFEAQEIYTGMIGDPVGLATSLGLNS